MSNTKLTNSVGMFKIRNRLVREFLAEFLGTMVLILFCDGVVAQVVLSQGDKGNFFTINWGVGLSVTMAVLVSGGVSGGHVNPAVSLALAFVGKFSWKKVPLYMAAQYLGAFVASALLFGVYYEALDTFEISQFNSTRMTPHTAGIWATYPESYLSHGSGMLDQVVTTGLLLLMICAICDKNNMNVAKELIPFYLGFVVLSIGLCFGMNSGYALNPARDIAPRIFTAIAGWGWEPFLHGNHWWVVPFIGTHIGAVVGAVVYSVFVENHWQYEEIELAEIDKNDRDKEYVKVIGSNKYEA